ncbi:hypothetical protein BpHYR1_014986 [Brachionus plicatilis]|uniref:Uncharacterized protein n=1 Tax=Brachionus plicatilis TaxID=10195 RepID=A0A3M7SWG5_BRAPC|nr:hypothetical protein BpHYR1_014986 [Brachionus plicatilis]
MIYKKLMMKFEIKIKDQNIISITGHVISMEKKNYLSFNEFVTCPSNKNCLKKTDLIKHRYEL